MDLVVRVSIYKYKYYKCGNKWSQLCSIQMKSLWYCCLSKTDEQLKTFVTISKTICAVQIEIP